MPRIERLSQALDDIEAIWSYIAVENFNRAAADRLLDRMDETLRLLAANPQMGTSHDELIAGLRAFSVGNYVLLYMPLPDGIRLLRVLHGARNFAEIFRTS